ncbi:MAG: hypothetical protein JWQ27_1455 [Ferruginibacter sp.]|nr:hypothetical protein [Ferruginibacter sp.]
MTNTAACYSGLTSLQKLGFMWLINLIVIRGIYELIAWLTRERGEKHLWLKR